MEVDYVWRIDCHQVARPGGDVQLFRVYIDEVELCEYVEDPISWADAYGTIEFVTESGSEWMIDNVLCYPIPLEYTYVGPTV